MADRGWSAQTRVLLAGTARGEALVLDEPLSLWGGLDPATGEIIDVHHPQRGQRTAGRVLVMPAGRGSSSSSSVLAEAIRLGGAPVAIVLAEADEILLLGALVVELLDGKGCPIVVAAQRDYRRLAPGDRLSLDHAGRLSVQPVRT
jgi:predicted aconitase with swiveling domain